MSMIARQWVRTVLEHTHPRRLLCSVQRALFFVGIFLMEIKRGISWRIWRTTKIGQESAIGWRYFYDVLAVSVATNEYIAIL